MESVDMYKLVYTYLKRELFVKGLVDQSFIRVVPERFDFLVVINNGTCYVGPQNGQPEFDCPGTTPQEAIYQIYQKMGIRSSEIETIGHVTVSNFGTKRMKIHFQRHPELPDFRWE
jgi:hypothetical protein